MRDMPTGLDTALSATKVYPLILVQLEWQSGTVRAWNGYHVLNWNGYDWQPTGDLGGISEITESVDGAANGVQLTLSGIPSATVAKALENDSQGRAALIWKGVISSAGIVIEPKCIFDGLIDFPTMVRNGETATILVNLEKELIDDRSNARRWTHEDQQIDFPGDRGFEYVPAIANKQLVWGKASPMAPAPSLEPVTTRDEL